MEKIKSMINSFTSFALKSVFAYAKNPSQAEMLGKYAEKICTPGYFALHLTTFTANIKYRIDSRAVKCYYEIAYLSNRFADVEN